MLDIRELRSGVLSAVLFSAFISRALGLIAGRGGLWSLLVFSGVQGSMLGLFTISEQLWALYACAILFGWAMEGFSQFIQWQ